MLETKYIAGALIDSQARPLYLQDLDWNLYMSPVDGDGGKVKVIFNYKPVIYYSLNSVR